MDSNNPVLFTVVRVLLLPVTIHVVTSPFLEDLSLYPLYMVVHSRLIINLHLVNFISTESNLVARNTFCRP